MFQHIQKYTVETELLRAEQDAVDAAFRSGDLSTLSALSAASVRRSMESFDRAARRQREECAGVEADTNVSSLPGVADWLRATAALADRQEAFARRLGELLPSLPESAQPLPKSRVKSMA